MFTVAFRFLRFWVALFAKGMKTNIVDSNRDHAPVKKPKHGPGSGSLERAGLITEMLSGLAAEREKWDRAAGGSMADLLAGWSAPQYLLAVRQELEVLPKNADRVKLLRQLVADSVALQYGAHWSPLLALYRERLEFEKKKHRQAVALAAPEVQKLRDTKRVLSDEDRLAIVDKVDGILGLK
jgi:hypothetical protein